MRVVRFIFRFIIGPVLFFVRSPLLQCGRHRYGERFSGGDQLAGKSDHPHSDQSGQPGFHGRKFHRRGRLHQLRPNLYGHRDQLHAPNHQHLCGRRDTFHRRGYRPACQADSLRFRRTQFDSTTKSTICTHAERRIHLAGRASCAWLLRDKSAVPVVLSKCARFIRIKSFPFSRSNKL